MLDIKKFIRGNGTKFIVISFRSTFRVPSNLMLHVRLLSIWAIMLFICSNAAFLDLLPVSTIVSFTLLVFYFIVSTRARISKRALLSTGSTQSACYLSSLNARSELYGPVTTSSSGKTTVLKRKTSGQQSSSIFRIRVPSPLPVPPPILCIRKKDYIDSHCSTTYLIWS